MAFTKRYQRNNPSMKTISCACGSKAKLCSRKNYPFGRKSGSITSWFYKCLSCKKIIFLNKDTGGKK